MSTAMHYQPWLQAVLTIAKHYRIEASEERLRLQLDWNPNPSSDELVTLMGRQIGLQVRASAFSPEILNPWRLPVLIAMHDGQVGVLDKLDAAGNASVQFSGDQGLAQVLTLQQLQHSIQQVYILRPEKSIPDVRIDEYVKPYESSWFWSIVLRDWKRYIDVMFASLMANILALATVLFSMNVYDRVIPAQSIPTLWVLAGGVLLAAIFEFSIRVARIYLSDIIGKRADLKISDRVFGHALRIKNKDRSKSTGTFISQIRELEGVRELVTSTTISAVADLPFFLLFLGIFWLIGGDLFWVMLAVVPLMILPGILIQKPLAKLAAEGMREGAIRNATLVEAVQGIEDIKLLRAEARFQNQWNHMNEVSAEISMRQRKLVGVVGAWTQKVQGLTFAIVVLVGCFAVMKGDMTTGALVACSILSSRMLGPIAQISGVLGRLQQAKVAKTSLDELMKKPVDQAEHAHLIHRTALHGQYELSQTLFKYAEDDAQATLAIQKLEIRAGEKIAILGRNGAGKSTLLQLLAGMQEPVQGKIKLDGVDLGLIDPADVRRDMGLLNQNAHLFFGTVRENLKLGAPLATDQDILTVLKMTGALDFVLAKKEGLDHQVLEGGAGFSGGQRQALLLSRLLLRQPNIVLLDEPTAALDDVTEKQLIDHLHTWLGQKTLVIATHRRAVLELVDRIIVLQDGKIVMDGSKQQILQQSVSNQAEATA
ncbi:type I secretion system permease/ATPase [Acinetobacter baumannii]|jgi:ATP-binding cassette subfamily C protein LapB|uniref:type I secretion system permease/ATPase n=1 Tax=Acinetobacter baumannii TaxID=470 RepID=UPI0016604F30|nr:type I secretion system permease/ATPase [Acinetobacter baumannii]MBD0470381.1 type I secretion system permease/ATPase [Acinetobacter baumannii]MCE6448311.1 type I secretion system permease/ATPase [Acinetobacter baumannii]MCE6455947.1 type I secretion system permease/ATPase [Acinetobacter baumannii]MCE6463577.1 type I secretion system permease/ATPase [Acinetobacter baumannii]MCE6474756.1 type I secretion system permease/ATPase [Acinetobacter baumannii]